MVQNTNIYQHSTFTTFGAGHKLNLLHLHVCDNSQGYLCQVSNILTFFFLNSPLFEFCFDCPTLRTGWFFQLWVMIATPAVMIATWGPHVQLIASLWRDPYRQLYPLCYLSLHSVIPFYYHCPLFYYGLSANNVHHYKYPLSMKQRQEKNWIILLGSLVC